MGRTVRRGSGLGAAAARNLPGFCSAIWKRARAGLKGGRQAALASENRAEWLMTQGEGDR